MILMTLMAVGLTAISSWTEIEVTPGIVTYCADEPSNGWTRIDYTLMPTSNSAIRCRLLLPAASRWTGRFWGIGNGSEGGFVHSYPEYAARGDASVHCDLGTAEGRHYQHAEVFDDFGWRATHLMTVSARALTERYYGRPIAKAYFRGGSTGGNQGLREAMDFPEDYDGIAVDVPAQSRVSMCALYWWINRISRDERGCVVITEAQCRAMVQAALDWFADKDEPYARGKFLTDPRYSPETEEAIYRLASRHCAELAAPGLRERWHAIFYGPVINGRRAHAGYPFGANFWRLLTRDNYNIDWLIGRNQDRTKATAETIERYARRFGGQLNAEKEDLSKFAARGGKLLVIPGLQDEYVPYTSSLDWYERTAEHMGGIERLREFCRLFLLPGRAHARGTGMHIVKNLPDVLIDWVERGIAPDRVESDDYPIAAYPDKITGDAQSGWSVKPFGRGHIARVDKLYLHGDSMMTPSEAARDRYWRTLAEDDRAAWYDAMECEGIALTNRIRTAVDHRGVYKFNEKAKLACLVFKKGFVPASGSANQPTPNGEISWSWHTESNGAIKVTHSEPDGWEFYVNAYAGEVTRYGFRIMKIRRGRDDHPPQLTLPDGWRVLSGEEFSGVNELEAFYRIEKDGLKQPAPCVSVSWPKVGIRTVYGVTNLVLSGESATFTPTTTKIPADIHTSLPRSGAVTLTIFHQRPGTAAGPHAKVPYPEREIRSAHNFLFALRRGFAYLGFDRDGALDGRIWLGDYDINYPNGHQDFPAHFHICQQGLDGGQTHHFYPKANRGLLDWDCYQDMTHPADVWDRVIEYRPSDTIPFYTQHGRVAYRVKMLEGGQGLEVSLPDGSRAFRAISPTPADYVDLQTHEREGEWQPLQRYSILDDTERGLLSTPEGDYHYHPDTGKLLP